MAGLVGTAALLDLTPVAAEAGAAEGDPRPIYTWEGPAGGEEGIVRSYPPSGGGAPRLVAVATELSGASLGVWDTATGAFLGALRGHDHAVCSLVTYGARTGAPGSPRARVEATCASGTATTFKSSAQYK
jgi:hypothetical protein